MMVLADTSESDSEDENNSNNQITQNMKTQTFEHSQERSQ